MTCAGTIRREGTLSLSRGCSEATSLPVIARAEGKSRHIVTVISMYREERNVSNMVLLKNTWSGNRLQDGNYRKSYRNLDMHDREEGTKRDYICSPSSALQEDTADGLEYRSRAARQQLGIFNILSTVNMSEEGRCISCKRTLPARECRLLRNSPQIAQPASFRL